MESEKQLRQGAVRTGAAAQSTNRRPQMDRADRAKQFMPFDALKGLREALAEKERELTLVTRRELSEESRAELDRQMCRIRVGDVITVEYYQRGEYVRQTGSVTRISANRREIRIGDKWRGEQRICADDIYELQMVE